MYLQPIHQPYLFVICSKFFIIFYSMRKIAPKFVKGRGAGTNCPGRFESTQLIPIDDGLEALDNPKKVIKTEITARSRDR